MREEAGANPAYVGRFSVTRQEDHITTGRDGTIRAIPAYRVIDADQDSELLDQLGAGMLNATLTPDGEELTAEVGVVVHSARDQLLILVVPWARRRDEIGLRIELLQALSEEPPPLPDYVLNFRTVVGSFGPEDLTKLRRDAQRVRDWESERELALEADRLAEQEHAERERRTDEHATLPSSSTWITDPEPTTSPSVPRPADDTDETDNETPALALPAVAEPAPIAAPVALATAKPAKATTDERTIIDQLPRGVSEVIEAEDEETLPYLDAAEALEVLNSSEIEIFDSSPENPVAVAAPVPTADEPTQAKPAPTAAGGVDGPGPRAGVAIHSEAARSETRWPAELGELRLGRGAPTLREDRVVLHFAVERQRLATFLQRQPEICLQLHRLPSYPVISLLLAARDEVDNILDELYCALDVEDPAHRELLAVLRQRYWLDVHLYDETGQRVQFLHYQKPLERNVEYLLGRAADWLTKIEQRQRDFMAAVALFSSEGFERVGARKPNLVSSSFAAIKTAGAARLAVSMVGYWSEEQNFEYLIANRSFSLEHFQSIQRRVCEAALRFGIFLPNELRQSAVSQGVAESESDIVEILIERFADWVQRGEAGDLDVMAQSENWDKLLTSAVDMGLAVDDRVSELSDGTRRKSRTTRSNPLEGVDLERTSEYQRIASLNQASNEDLRRFLLRSGLAQAASQELVDRGGETNILFVIEAARALDEDGLMATARFLAAGAEVFEPALLIGLGRVHPRTVYLCALALALSKRVEALPTLIELLHDSTRSMDVPVREIIAEYGQIAIAYLFDAIMERGATDPLVEVLALLSIDCGAAIIAMLRERPAPALLEAAQKMTAVRRRLESRKAREATEVTDREDEGGPDVGSSAAGEST